MILHDILKYVDPFVATPNKPIEWHSEQRHRQDDLPSARRGNDYTPVAPRILRTSDPYCHTHTHFHTRSHTYRGARMPSLPSIGEYTGPVLPSSIVLDVGFVRIIVYNVFVHMSGLTGLRFGILRKKIVWGQWFRLCGDTRKSHDEVSQR